MGIETELAKYGQTGIALALIGIIFWVVKWAFSTGTRVAKELSESIQANTSVTNENLEYLKKRNGSLEENNRVVCATLERITKKLDKIDDEVRK